MDHYFTTAYNPDEIVELRKKAFFNKYQSKVNLDGLNWNKTDAHSHHFSYRHSYRLTSSLRITFYQDIHKFNQATQIFWNNTEHGPYVLLARAATLPEYKNLQLHSLLRIQALQFCLQNGVKSVYGSLQKKSNRLPKLLEGGYEILQTQSSWTESYLQNEGDVVLIGLMSQNKIRNFIESEMAQIKVFQADAFQTLKPIIY